MAKPRGADCLAMLKGFGSVTRAAISIKQSETKQCLANTSILPLLSDVLGKTTERLTNCVSNPGQAQNALNHTVSETLGRAGVVTAGLKEYAKYAAGLSTSSKETTTSCATGANTQEIPLETNADLAASESQMQKDPNALNAAKSTNFAPKFTPPTVKFSTYTAFAASSPKLMWLKSYARASSQISDNVPKPEKKAKPTARKSKPTLSPAAKERPVPASRIARLASYGGLAAGLGLGALAEVTRRNLGFREEQAKSEGSGALFDTDNPFLTPANMERIVSTLCKVRGAALKLGQMLSIQDNSMINPQLRKIFERVRQSADFMPYWQLEHILVKELGKDWKSKLANFEEKPFAAASIGQVHLATLHDGRDVAMKIQYPGVADGIDSDINNMMSVMKLGSVLPEGLYMESLIAVAKRELAWEVDYIREADCTRRFKKLLSDCPEFKVPVVIDEFCTKQIFTAELVEGIPVEKCVDMDQETRNFIGAKMLELCLRELFEFRFMQTDPNWANFFFNKETNQIVLLDFGASREYSKPFVDRYIRVIEGAAERDRDKVYRYSKELGFLTGYESKVMENAHVDAVMILGEAFQFDKPFDFGQQDTTRRIQHLIPVLLNHRLCAPPEESYSLHRKLSGAFLLCARLGSCINCKPFFDNIREKYYALNNDA